MHPDEIWRATPDALVHETFFREGKPVAPILSAPPLCVGSRRCRSWNANYRPVEHIHTDVEHAGWQIG